MSKMRKTDWLAEMETQKRDFNTAARWALKYRPNDEETVENYKDLGLCAPSHRMSAAARAHTHKAEQKALARTAQEQQRRSPGRGSASGNSPVRSDADGGGGDGSSSAPQQQPRRIHIRHKHKRVCPEHAQHEIALRQAASSAERAVDATTTTATTTNKTNDGRELTNKMVRQQPLTYLLNERAEELQKLGLARPPPMLLPGLQIPHVAGAGMCRMLTGGMPVHNAKHFERRPNKDHPDFTKCTVDATAVAAVPLSASAGATAAATAANTAATLLTTKRGRHSVNAQDVGGFNIAGRLQPESVAEAAEYLRRNRPGALANTDKPSADHVVLQQLHHAMTNRHRQFIYPVPEGAEQRARRGRELVTSARDVDTSDSDLEEAHPDGRAAAVVARANATAGAASSPSKSKQAHSKAHLPASALVDTSLRNTLSASRKERLELEHSARQEVEEKERSAALERIAASCGDKRRLLIQQERKKQQQRESAHLAAAAAPMLLRIPVDRTHARLKNDIKKHHEQAASVGGKVMMRGAKAF